MIRALALSITVCLAASAFGDDLDYLRLRLRLLELEQVSTLVQPKPAEPKPTVICPDCDGEGCDKCGGDGRIEPFTFTSEAKAKATGKPVWYFIKSDSCTWCRKAELLHRSPEVQAATQHFACVKINASQAPRDQWEKWAKHFGFYGRGVPIDLFVYPDGTFKPPFVGCPPGAAEYAARLNSARTNHGQVSAAIIDGGQPAVGGGDFICVDGVCRPSGDVVFRPAPRLRMFAPAAACPSCR